jgi:hypothetical protein
VLAGHSVLFRTAADLLADLDGDSPGLRRRKFRFYPRSALLVIDEYRRTPRPGGPRVLSCLPTQQSYPPPRNQQNRRYHGLTSDPTPENRPLFKFLRSYMRAPRLPRSQKMEVRPFTFDFCALRFDFLLRLRRAAMPGRKILFF